LTSRRFGRGRSPASWSLTGAARRQGGVTRSVLCGKGLRHEVISDLGCGLNYKKKGMNRLLELILHKRIRRLVLTHKDRLLRFGSELIFALCEIQNIEIVTINKGEPPSFKEELAADVIEIITVFSARLYGSRSHKTKRLLGDLKEGDLITKAADIAPDDEAMPLLLAMQSLVRSAIAYHSKLVVEGHDAPRP
jgi:hypothetical protein